MDKPKCKKGKAAVKASLLEQLEGKGADKSVFVEQVDSYMELYDVAKALQKDIKKRGINYEEFNSQGFPVTKENPSVKSLVAVSKQMLTILEKLGITTDKVIAPEEEL